MPYRQLNSAETVHQLINLAESGSCRHKRTPAHIMVQQAKCPALAATLEKPAFGLCSKFVVKYKIVSIILDERGTDFRRDRKIAKNDY